MLNKMKVYKALAKIVYHANDVFLSRAKVRLGCIRFLMSDESPIKLKESDTPISVLRGLANIDLAIARKNLEIIGWCTNRVFEEYRAK